MSTAIDFVEVYARQVILRRVFLLLSLLFFIGMLFFLILWGTSPPPKTTHDFLREYVHARYNYDYNTVERAFFNELQYMPLLYETFVSAEMGRIKEGKITSFFRIDRINPLQNNIYEVHGRRLIISMAMGSANIISNEVIAKHIGVTNGRFYETVIQR
jgi:hypothetical protein